MSTLPPALLLMGPTASGKTALALDIAERHDGEIICAWYDRQILPFGFQPPQVKR